ncbi:hypothetical protein J437_LFUL011940 [Ladona fulva]|uniref:UFSP1/2/DUB catalytic domain-containing protein n=1 Tax=Ladona fulva TaxID=123851 RepID=A0A8K0NYH8_LADFU|nr:hypothetical protein J437_LFUL011940 [Ladona fulva]
MYVIVMSPINYSDSLLKNVHDNLAPPTQSGKTYLISGDYLYYHYGCDGFDDRGWGCGYRTLQMIISWIIPQLPNTPVSKAPDIPSIQKILVSMEDKPSKFYGSRDWIGSYEVCLVVDELFGIPSKITHVTKDETINQHLPMLKQHFTNFGSPVMIGGDMDCSSKGVVGIHYASDDSEAYLLIVDPHFVGVAKSVDELQRNDWVKWYSSEDFMKSSFYNICQPQIKSRT